MKKLLMFGLLTVMALGLLTACGGGGPAHKLELIAGEGDQMIYNPATLSVKKGETVEVTLVNKDSASNHSFVIPGLNGKGTQIAPGKTEVIKFTASKTGEFEFYCDVPGHKDGGMVGKLTVQ